MVSILGWNLWKFAVYNRIVTLSTALCVWGQENIQYISGSLTPLSEVIFFCSHEFSCAPYLLIAMRPFPKRPRYASHRPSACLSVRPSVRCQLLTRIRNTVQRLNFGEYPRQVKSLKVKVTGECENRFGAYLREIASIQVGYNQHRDTPRPRCKFRLIQCGSENAYFSKTRCEWLEYDIFKHC